MAILRALVLLEIILGLLVRCAVLRGNHALEWLYQLEPTTDETDDDESSHELWNASETVHFVAGVPKIKVRKAKVSQKKRTKRGKGTSRSSAQPHAILDVNCMEPFAGPDENSFCPEDCPYMRFDPDRMCHFKCITKEWCLTAPNMPSSFPDDDLGKCVPCAIAGCRKCLSPTQCEEDGCKTGFDMVNGECKPKSRHMWGVILMVVGAVVLVAAVYLFRVWSRPISQSIRSKQAELYRSMSKVRHGTEGHKFYDLNTNLCSEPICGIGVLLHFRFQAFWLLWAFGVLVCSGLISFYFGRFKATDVLAMTPTHEEVFRECEGFGSGTALQLWIMQEVYNWFSGILYVLTTAACFAFAIRQRQAFQKEDDLTASMEDFALCASHMPIEESKDNLEEEYFDFFKRVYGDNVIGVSICWDYTEVQEAVETGTAGQLHNYDKEFDHHFLTEDEQKKLEEETSQQTPRISKECFELRCLDKLMCGTDDDVDYASKEEENTELAKLVRQLKTTGYVFVIFLTEASQLQALKSTKEKEDSGEPIKFPRAEYNIRLSRESWDPATVIWTGFSVPRGERIRNIMHGIMITLLVIVVWAVCFYGPYVVYVLSWSAVAGATQGDATTMSLLGLMCAIGNQVVYATCAKVADNAGFRSKDLSMAFNCCLYTAAVLINIIVDVSLMVVMAHGFQQDSGMDPGAAIRNPSFQYSLFLQLVGYLYPMTLLVPYLAEPIPMNIIPYFLGKWMVRSAARISRFNAEQALVCPEFDLLRYGDIIINVSTVIGCLFLATSSLWWIFMWLFVSNLVIYGWDHIRLLRFCEETVFANDLMETCSQYISALPCALLAAAFTFKKFNGQEVLKSFDMNDVSSTGLSDISKSLWFSVVGAFLMHVVFHTLVICFVIPRFVPDKGDPTEDTYADIATIFPHTWFNSNPVHCLRSQSLGWKDHDPPIIFHQRGKEYVHQINKNIHQYYDGADRTEYNEMETVQSVMSGIRRRRGSAIERMEQLMARKRSTKLGDQGPPQDGIDHLDDSQSCIIS
jgi:hypothetical protein